jgi:N-acetylmuramate 1-kinase
MTVAYDANLDEVGVIRLAEVMVCLSRTGDCIALYGDLGAGKTAFARGFIRAAMGDDTVDVPSPTFALQQSYAAPRFQVLHTDLYRLTSEQDVEETGLVEAMDRAVTLIEWPERAGMLLPEHRLEITLTQGLDSDRRRVSIAGVGRMTATAQRIGEILTFLQHAPIDLKAAHIRYMQGDASTRSYARVTTPVDSFVLMDAPRQPDGPVLRNDRTYSQIAHLAEDVRPFVAIGQALHEAGLSAPEIVAADLERGLLLLEDLGDRVYGDEIRRGTDQSMLVVAAVTALGHLRKTGISSPLRLPDGSQYRLPRRDRAAFEIEIDLLLDWYWPSVFGAEPSADIRAEFGQLWSPVIDRLLALPTGVFLRDFHSPNLIWLPDRSPPERRAGIIDFQDALAEHWSFDLVSLLQDARVDVSEHLEQQGYAQYCAIAAHLESAFDRQAFAVAYADFGAQRNTRLIGLWARLLKRDGKANYLQHLPRTWRYLERNLTHPQLSDVKAWFDRHLPPSVRKLTPKA